MKNNKILWGALAVVIVAAFFYMTSSKDAVVVENSEDVATTTQAVATSTPENKVTTATKPAAATTPAVKTGVVKNFKTVAEAVNSGASVRCVSTSGPVTNTFYIARGKVRRDSASLSGTSYITVRPDAIFTWNLGSSNETDYTGTLAATGRADVLNTSLVNVSCLTANIADSTFARP